MTEMTDRTADPLHLDPPPPPLDQQAGSVDRTAEPAHTPPEPGPEFLTEAHRQRYLIGLTAELDSYKADKSFRDRIPDVQAEVDRVTAIGTIPG